MNRRYEITQGMAQAGEFGPIPPAEATQKNLGGLGVIVVTAIAAMTVISVIGLIVNHQSAVTAIVTGALFFAFLVVLCLLILSGTITAVVTAWQVQKTLRLEVKHHYAALPGPPPNPLPALAETPASPQQTPSFVAPVEAETARDAILWAMALYMEDGTPNPAKVNLSTVKEAPGRLKVAAPAGATREHLLHKRVLQTARNGYKLNVLRYPTATDLKELLR